MAYADKRKERINRIISEVYQRIDFDILKEAPTHGVKIGVQDLMKTDVNKLSQIAQKADINVVDKIQEADTDTDVLDVSKDITVKGRKVYTAADEAQPGEQVQFTVKGKTYTAIVSEEELEDKFLLKDVKLVSKETSKPIEEPDTPEEKQVESTQQEQAIYNLKNWANQLQMEIGDGELSPNNAVKFVWFSQESQQPISILVLSNGLIRMSGHTVQDFSDLKNIINFHSNK